ncbi:DNA (cytosine-5)-methyltransferase 1 [Arcticibacter tournemirensis]|nr:DNA cytosine methyltransferase [Arcticibacter tournemirensis]TQM50061.1 DNA (cytosine-5)-methyltransferase 1 [Arcticibacter tournemirensis]
MINAQYFLHAEGGGFRPQIVAKPEEIEFLIIDLFCGAGGTTTGFDMAKLKGHKCALVIACVNHDAKAIRSHWENHPEVVHFEEDIRTLDLSPLSALLIKYRIIYPNAKVILWGSLECTNFSKAKGGQPRDADSRTLAEHLPRYIIALNPDYVQIENVVEFMSWGPLDENGKPLSKRSGADWMKWRGWINSLGYYDEWREMNSADYGAYTSRNRLFGCFAKHGLPIVWPEPTHAKKPVKESLFGDGLKKWKAVKDVLDFEDEGESIFTRKKPLSDKTLERIYAGLIKYVAGGKDQFLQQIYACSSNSANNYELNRPARTITTRDATALVSTSFIAKYYSGKPEGKVIPVTGPAGSITCVDGQSIVQPKFMVQRNSGEPESKVVSVDGPARTLTATGGNQEIVQTKFIMNYHHSSDVNSIENPSPTLVTRDKLAIVNPAFITKYYGKGNNISSVDDPSGTITTKDRLTKVQAVWLDKTYTGKNNHQSIEQPAGVVTVNDHHQLVQTYYMLQYNGGLPEANVFGIDRPMRTITAGHGAKHNVVKVEPFIMDTNYSNVGSSISEPKRSLLASRRHSYIINPSHGGCNTSTDQPSPVIVARQDKAPLYLAQCEEGEVIFINCPGFLTSEDIEYLYAIEALLEGTEVMLPEKSVRIKIIDFMIMYGIADIKMRMLKVAELKLIQGFPAHYKLHGNQSDQKKFIGNSVVPHVVTAWCETMSGRIREIRRAA